MAAATGCSATKPTKKGIYLVKIYGQSQKRDANLEMLVEATLVADPSTLRDLASFLYRCADAIEDEGDDWEHDQFESNEAVSASLVVFNPNVVSTG